MKKITSQNTYVLVFLWLSVVCASAGWNIYQAAQARREVYLETARSFFELILTTREWVSNMGGVYVPVTPAVQPNPYLNVPDRDIILPDGKTLTKVNPAYMTRLLAELAATKNNALFHITSLNPIRPANIASDWEAAALTAFEQKREREYAFFDKEDRRFYYMAPLVTQASCLSCHASQGYQVGDIRGGISIVMKTRELNLWPLLSSHLLIGGLGGVLIYIFSSRLEKAVALLQKQSNQDGLTQIPNRSYFDSYVQREFLRARRQKTPLSVLLCDVDHFKAYNDTFGHLAGDGALKQVAAALSDLVKRPGDLVARYGGEEFVVILPDTPLEGARAVAENLRAGIEQLGINHPGNKVSSLLTLSIGFWTYDGEDMRLEDMLQRADQALYLAKKSGRNLVCAFQEDLAPR